MTLREIALRNLVRRKGKAAFVLAGLVIGVGTVIALVSFVDTATTDINHKLEKFGANILIVPRTENLTLSYGGMSLGGVSFEMAEIQESDLNRIESIKNYRNVAAVGPLVLGVVRAGGQPVLLAGIDFETVQILKPWWKVRGRLPSEAQVVLGSETARILGLNLGDTLTLKDRPLQVAGILNTTGSQDDQLIFTPRSLAQALLQKEGRVSMVEVAALCQACPIDEMVRQLSVALPGANVMAIQQVVKGRMQTLAHFRKFSYGVSAVVILIGSLVVLVTMMGSVRERTEEIGIFRAIGYRRSHVMHIIFLEAGIISVIAGVVGYLAGLGATQLALRVFSANTDAAVTVDPMLFAAAVLMALITGIVASAYPALLAARMDPNQALRAL